MLAFLNINQLVSNLSQVTSAVSSSYVRVTSTPAKKKPVVDVLCSESFLHTLNNFQQSDNAKLFSSLPNIKFGPKFEDIQWVYCNDVELKFTAQKSVDEKNFYISTNKNSFKSFSPDLLNFSKLDGQWCKQQKKILKNLENLLTEKSTCENFASKMSFDQNKNCSRCASNNKKSSLFKTSPVFSNLVGCNHSFTSSPNVGYMQTRGFKTRRVIELQEKTNTDFSSNLDSHGGGTASYFERMRERAKERAREKARDMVKKSSVVAKMVEEAKPDDQVKLKISFAEGYMVATQDKYISEKIANKVINTIKNIVIITIIGIMYMLSEGGRRKIFPFSFHQNGEIDPEAINVNFSDVKGIEEAKDELQEIVDFLRNPSKFSTMGGKLPKGVLLVGPPGTGKTLLARAIAGEANVPFFQISGSEFDEVFVGEGARRVRNLFKTAKAKSPSIIFIDEIDCVGSKRKTSIMHPYANQTINQLLSEMDGFLKNEGVIIMGATNRKEDLDPALLRPGRFDVEIQVSLPNLEGRKEILQLYVNKIRSTNINVDKLAKDMGGCTGADIAAMVNHAAIRAACEGASYVTMEHLENAKDKILIGPERKSAMKSEEGNLITAYHEGGHTLVAYFTEGVKISKVTIVPRGPSLGHTALVDEEDPYTTKAMCMGQLDVLLGGRAAEELIFGANKITANAASDLEKATALASTMVKKFGMSEKVGLRTIKSGEGEFSNPYGQMMTDQVDMEVKRLVNESYERAKNILKKHTKEHKLLAEALLKYKTLSSEDVRAIVGDNVTEKGTGSTATVLN